MEDRKRSGKRGDPFRQGYMSGMTTETKALDYLRRSHALVVEADILMQKHLNSEQAKRLHDSATDAETAISAMKTIITDAKV